MNRRSMILASAAALAGATAWRSAPAPEGRPVVLGQSYVIPSVMLRAQRRLNVFLPASYGEGQARYPVLYLLDGGEQEDFLHIASLAQISGAYGVTREFIVVGIESGPERRRHMTFPSTEPDDVKAIPTNGGSEVFRGFVNIEVRAWVEKTFRVTDERVLMGESLAGLFTIETLLRQPDAFSAYIAVDPSLWWNKGSLPRDRSLPGWKALSPRRRVFVAMSNQGPASDAAHLTEGMTEAADYTYWPMPEQTHAGVYHPAAVDALRVIFAPPPAAPGT